ncbi:RND family efflux transporter MFP subunit [Alteromonadaceae bacterium 2753L.S.0a.02]|nr:RND family efflux transporter MFP subunit [Alteromonadaceae bacterium 2753L.S.0a.02]
MDSSNDKKALLQQLTISEQTETTSGFGMAHLIAAALLGAAASGFLVWWLLPQTAAAPTPVASKPLITAQTEAPKKNIVNAAVLNASGYITARRVATVSSEVMGRIISVDVEEGMAVAEDQILARLDDEAARVNLDLARAQIVAQRERINSFQTDLEEARRVLNRVTQLDHEKFTSEAALTRAQADVKKATAGLATSRAELRVAELNAERLSQEVDDHTIRAPFSGVITVKNAQPGEIVAPAAAGGGFTRTGICTLVDMDSLEIEVDVNEAFIGRVAAGQKVIANLDAYPQWDIPAQVIAIIPTADRAKATVAVRIALQVKDARVLPNMGVKVAFLDNSSGANSVN